MAKEKLIPAEAIENLMNGSYESLIGRIANSLGNSSLFEGVEAEKAVIATFADHVVVGTADGEYFKVKFEDRNGKVHFVSKEAVQVPVIDESNSSEYVRGYVMETVDAIISGDKDTVRDRLVALLNLESTSPSNYRDFSDIVVDLINKDRTWRSSYNENKSSICGVVGDLLEGIGSRKFESKYNKLFDSIPEEEFGIHAEDTTADLAIVADRLETIQTKAESSFYPFTELVCQVEHSEEDEFYLHQFADLSEDYLDDIHGLREHVAYALQNEKCIMCLGKIYDALAEALTDYEIAGSFIERMSRQLVDPAV